MITAASLLAQMCLWQAYQFNSPIPTNAVLIGVNVHDNAGSVAVRMIDFAYVARLSTGRGLYRVYRTRKVSAGILWDESVTKLTYHKFYDQTGSTGEILQCDPRYVRN